MTLGVLEEHQNAWKKSPQQHKLNGIFSNKSQKKLQKKAAIIHLSH